MAAQEGNEAQDFRGAELISEATISSGAGERVKGQVVGVVGTPYPSGRGAV